MSFILFLVTTAVWELDGAWSYSASKTNPEGVDKSSEIQRSLDKLTQRDSWELISRISQTLRPENSFSLGLLQDRMGVNIPMSAHLNVQMRLHKLEYYFTTLKIFEEDCKRRLLCEIAKDPAKFSPLSFAFLDETRYNGEEKVLTERLLTSNEGSQLLAYIELLTTIVSYHNGSVRGEMDPKSKRVPIRNWNSALFIAMMNANNMKLILEGETEFKTRKPTATIPFNDPGPSSCRISSVSRGFGHIYYAYGIKDAIANLYLGINRNVSVGSPILAKCHNSPSKDQTGLGTFIRENPDIEIQTGILFHIESVDDQDEVESATILAAVLNNGGHISLNDQPTPFKLLNLSVDIHHQSPPYRQALRHASLTLFGKRPNFIVKGPLPDTKCGTNFFNVFS